MADLDTRKSSAEDKFAQELGVLASFLDPNLKARTEDKLAGGGTLWSWRKTMFFIVMTGLIGWSAILGLGHLLIHLLG